MKRLFNVKANVEKVDRNKADVASARKFSTSEDKKFFKFRIKSLFVFKNVRIAPKLLIGFFIITLFGAGMGLYTSVSMDAVSATNTKIYEEMLVPQRNISNISNTYQKSRIDFRNLTHMEAVEIERIAPAIKSSMKWLSSSIDSIEPLMSADSKELIENFRAEISEYTEKLMLAIEGLQTGNREAIVNDLLRGGELYTTEKRVTDALDKLNTASTKEAIAQQAVSKKNADNAKMITYSIIGVELIVSIIIAIIIARGISRPVKKLTNGLNLLASGETDIPETGINSKDEIGQMWDAFRSIITSIQTLNQDTLMLINAATEGQLSIRADAEKHHGSYRKIIEGFNATLDAVTMPVSQATQVLGEVSKGNLDTFVKGDLKGDHAIIKSSLNDTIEILKRYIREISFVLGEVANGKLYVGINTDYRGDFTELKNSINKIIGSLNKVLSEIEIAAVQISLGTNQLTEGSQVIAQGATEQASAIYELSTSLMQISEQTNLNAERATNANEITKKVQTNAVIGNEQMKEMQRAMEEINGSSVSISKIIKIIDEIAFQTNILALNAAVEAARAGIHGKSFAVVAEEVRNLAARSAKAASETEELIKSSIDKVESGTRIADATALALSDIVAGAKQAAILVNDIAAASNDQALGIQHINTSIEQLNTVVQSNSSTAEEAAASSQELSGQAEMLKYMVKQFKLVENEMEQPKDSDDVVPEI